MQHSTFSVAGMSTSTSSHHGGPNLNAWGNPGSGLTTSLSDTLAQSRSHYQPGYMMSASQSSNIPQGSQRIDEIPVVKTKATMNHVLSRGSVSDFGMESMFQSSRQNQHQTLADEDAPPMASINDLPTEMHVDAAPLRHPRAHPDDSPFGRRSTHARAPSAAQPPQTLFLVVFGYPPDKYSATVAYFQSLGAATEADPHAEIVNCFRIGFAEPGDALRAVRKNGEVLGGTWMVGVKWQDPAQAEALIGQPVARSAALPELAGSPSSAMAIDDAPARSAASTPSVGTPIRLAPSASAFRKGGPGPGAKAPPSTPAAGVPPGGAAPGFAVAGQSPSKGMLGQVSDLIFGW